MVNITHITFVAGLCAFSSSALAESQDKADIIADINELHARTERLYGLIAETYTEAAEYLSDTECTLNAIIVAPTYVTMVNNIDGLGLEPEELISYGGAYTAYLNKTCADEFARALSAVDKVELSPLEQEELSAYEALANIHGKRTEDILEAMDVEDTIDQDDLHQVLGLFP